MEGSNDYGTSLKISSGLVDTSFEDKQDLNQVSFECTCKMGTFIKFFIYLM